MAMPNQMAPQAPPQQAYNPEPEALRNLMVNYIPTTVDEMQLRQLFERCGPIESVKIVCDRETRQSRGYGFVKFQTAASSQQAINELNGFTLLNKRLKVALAASGNQRQRQNPQGQMGGGQMGGGQMGGQMYYGANNFGYQQAPNPYAQQQMLAMQQQQYLMQQQAPQQQQQQPPQQQQQPPQQR